MKFCRTDRRNCTVALLAEGVDRNVCEGEYTELCYKSPSSRRAWIEMESFDGKVGPLQGRPPRGGRG